ncbi:MAG: hypothetical protein DCF31_16020 [Alphaproteobacteria bacterium]|nr:MAG: hypothetical protein DCF31_16020 [Alphaproteobacteria bacterium]
MRFIVIALGAATLLATAAGAAEPAPVAAATPPVDPMQQVVCRRDVETGSLVKAKKTCHTRAQWAYIDDTNQAFSRDLVDTTRTRSSGN